VLPLAHKHNVKILPADSEHSAIFQVSHKIITSYCKFSFLYEYMLGVMARKSRYSWMFKLKKQTVIFSFSTRKQRVPL
jgi:hypothetical protein